MSWAIWRRERGPAALDVRRGSRLTSADLVLGAAERGLGIALARGQLAAEALSQERLVRPLGDAQITLRHAYWLVGQIGEDAREAVRLCSNWLRDEASRSSTS